ncbi:MAG TPA: hypothetical protein VFO60_11565 [Candidatus Dormibacteraeota bacterium]|nr:hypothetical protein [Candidatus Dormibacteraeota bacterium]
MPLVELRMTDVAVLRSARLSPGRRLTILSGETGSGKSLCVAALRLAVGARLDGVPPIRAGAGAARVAAVFADVPDSVRTRLEVLGIADDDLLTLSRELAVAGRGACRINGALVSLATLREVGEELVEITAQGASHRLLRASSQRAAVDAAGGRDIAALRTAMSAAASAVRDAERAHEAARRTVDADADALLRARETVADLAPTGLRAGEDAELAAERRRLVDAERLAVAADAVRRASAGDEGGAADMLAVALAAGRGLTGIDAGLDDLLADARLEVDRLRDLGGRAREVVASFEVDPGRLEAVEERLHVLDRVVRQFGSIEEALRQLDRARRAVDEADAGDGDLRRLATAVESARTEAARIAAQLAAARADAAARLERDVTAQLRRLRLPHARLRVVLGRQPDDEDGLDVDGERVAWSADGIDTLEMRLSVSRDGVPLPLDAVSGGELSRVALALRSVVTLGDECPTLVFDEVDTGLGGETAARVGEVLADVGARRQVVVVTHRPEIAARADVHLVVQRCDGAAGPESAVEEVSGDARAVEVARLMSGRPTAAAVARAVELLAEGAGARGASPDARTMAPR